MKKKELQELRAKTEEQLVELIKKAQQELVKIRLEKEAGRLRDIHQVTKKSNDLARLKTILKELELNENI
jgi:ribosomal protein L29